MVNFLTLYQHLPERISPDIFSVGPFSVEWYSLMYIAAFLTVYFILTYRLKKREANFSRAKILDFLLYAIVGVIVGGRLGYVLFYNLPYYLHDPLAIIYPFDPATGRFVGLRGMSYHGGLIGVILASWIFVRNNKIDFWRFSDFIVPAIPAGYFFGRIGNFLNGELYGRITASPVGMYFVSDPLVLRYPSQLFEATLEGLLLFCLLWFLRNKKFAQDYLLILYLVGYGLLRFAAEFFRQPDPQIGYLFHFFTLGQILSLSMALAGGVLALIKRRKKSKIEANI